MRLDRHRARDQAIQQHADAVDVALDAGLAAAEQFGRHVQRRADLVVDERALVGHRVAAGAEVHQHEAAVAVAHDVLRLDVAMQQPGGVHGRQRRAHVDADERDLARVEAADPQQHGFERLALDQFHPQADEAAAALGAEDRRDVRMLDARQQARLADDVLAAAFGRRDRP